MKFAIIFWIALSLISIYAWVDVIKDKGSCCKNVDEVDTELIDNMTGREFEELCTYLFRRTGKYKNVELTVAERDGGKDIILTTKDNEKIFVECKRYTDQATETEHFMIGREICQKLVGAMAGEGIKKGLIMTVGNIHHNAWDYINNLEKHGLFELDIITRDMVFKMVQDAKTENKCDKVIENLS